MAFNRESFEHFWEHLEILFGNKVDKETGKSLMKNTEITRLASVKTGLELGEDTESLGPGMSLILNADQLGGLNASDYVTKQQLIEEGKSDVISVNGNIGNVVITAEDLGAIKAINGMTPDNTGHLSISPQQINAANEEHTHDQYFETSKIIYSPD